MFSFMNPGKSKPAKKGLKIIIVGCGKVGLTLTEQLNNEGHDITVIDKDGAKLRSVTDNIDVMGVEGNGAIYQRADGCRN